MNVRIFKIILRQLFIFLAFSIFALAALPVIQKPVHAETCFIDTSTIQYPGGPWAWGIGCDSAHRPVSHFGFSSGQQGNPGDHVIFYDFLIRCTGTTFADRGDCTGSGGYAITPSNHDNIVDGNGVSDYAWTTTMSNYGTGWYQYDLCWGGGSYPGWGSTCDEPSVGFQFYYEAPPPPCPTFPQAGTALTCGEAGYDIVTDSSGLQGSSICRSGASTFSSRYSGNSSCVGGTFSCSLCKPSSFTTSAPSCPSPGTLASLSWNSSSAPADRGTIQYNLRVDDSPDSWTPCTSPDRCFDNTGLSESFSTTAGRSYGWWVDACNNSGCSASSRGSDFSCAAPASTTIAGWLYYIDANGNNTGSVTSGSIDNCISSIPINSNGGFSFTLNNGTGFCVRGPNKTGYTRTAVNRSASDPTNAYESKVAGTNNVSYDFSYKSDFDFSIDKGSSTKFIDRGSNTTNTIYLGLASGSTTDVNLSAASDKSGITFTFSTNPCRPGTTCTNSSPTTLTMTAASGATIGNHTITVTGTGGGKTHSTVFTLTVQSPTPFSFHLNDGGPRFVNQGAQASNIITVIQDQGATAEPVTLRTPANASGITYSFNSASAVTTTTCTPSGIPPTCSVTLYMNADSAATPGLRPNITVSATSATVTTPQTTAFNLTVQSIGSIALNTTPSCAASSPKVDLSWNTISGGSPYSVFRNTSSYVTGLTTGPYSDTGVTPSAQYNYYIDPASGSNSNTATVTAPVCATPAVAPNPHACISAPIGAGDSSVTISWNSSENPGVNWVDISSDNFTTYYHKSVSGTSTTGPDGFNGFQGVSGPLTMNSGTPYFIRTWNSTSNQHSPTYSNYIIPACGAAPTITLTSATGSPVASCATPYAELAWTSSGLGASPTYNIYRDGNFIDSTGSTSYSNNTGLTAGTSYNYQIRSGATPSNILSATPAACTGGGSSTGAWIQTTGGDVHSNTRINTPGGP